MSHGTRSSAHTSNHAHSLSEHAGNLRDDLGNLRGSVGDTAAHVTEAAKAGVREVGRYVSDAVDTVKEKSAQTAKSARKTISTHPLASVAIAVGVGALVGAILMRRR